MINLLTKGRGQRIIQINYSNLKAPIHPSAQIHPERTNTQKRIKYKR
jgi:hypothetical protein